MPTSFLAMLLLDFKDPHIRLLLTARPTPSLLVFCKCPYRKNHWSSVLIEIVKISYGQCFWNPLRSFGFQSYKDNCAKLHRMKNIAKNEEIAEIKDGIEFCENMVETLSEEMAVLQRK